MEWSGISELIGNGRGLRNRGVENVTPLLQVQILIIPHCVDLRRERK
jgi:hypothetical protein